MSSQLFKHIVHPHTPRNIIEVHKAERAAHTSLYARFNEKAAVRLTRIFQSMLLFWTLNLFLVIWMGGNSIGLWHFDPMPFPLLLFLWNIPQLPLLPLLAIGQSILGRRQELQAQEQFDFTEKSYHDIEQVMQHLSVQDEELVKQTKLLLQLLKKATGE